MLLELLSLFVVLTLGVLSPGPDFLLVLKNTIGGSRGRAFATVAGIAGGLLVQVTAIAIGLTAIDAGVLRGVQLVGAVFLAWIGVRTLRPALRTDPARRTAAPQIHAAPSVGDAFVEGLGCNLTNPKAFLFYVSMTVHVLPPQASTAWRAALPLLFVVHAALAWVLVVLALQAPPMASRLAQVQRPLMKAFGVALLLLAAWILIEAW